MNEVIETGAAAPVDTSVSTEALSAGAMLRRAREATGMHVAALAVAMKIPVKKLEALESDRLDQLHDAVFIRALASSVCRALRVDAAPILDKLPQNTAPKLNVDERGINTPFHTHGQSSGSALQSLFSNPRVWLVLALLLGVLGVLLYPERPQSDSAVVIQPPVGTVSSDSNVGVATKESGVVVVDVPSGTSPGLPVTSLVAAAPAPAPAVTGVSPEAAAVNGMVVASPNNTARMPVAATPVAGLVQFKARGTTWVQVVDAKGVIQLSKTLVTGDVAAASGSLPLTVVVGRADVTDVQVRGSAFGLATVARDNVARFEVK